MHVFFKSKDERVWFTIMNGQKVPTIIAAVKNVIQTKPKPPKTCCASGLESAKWNSKGLNAIHGHVTEEEFTNITMCDTSKEVAWDILEIVYKGTNCQKLQNPTSNFRV